MTEYDTIEEGRNAEKQWRDKDLMETLYHEKGMSQDEIADHFDNKITQAGVGYCLDQLGIEKCDRSEAAKLRWQKLRDPEHLRRLADEIEAALEGDNIEDNTRIANGLPDYCPNCEGWVDSWVEAMIGDPVRAGWDCEFCGASDAYEIITRGQDNQRPRR